MDSVSQLDGAQEPTFTNYGFKRKSHSADKFGTYSEKWKGQILLTTDQQIMNEIEVQRDIEALVISGSLPMFGQGWRLAAITFSWTPTTEELQLMGQDTRCLIRLTYLSEIDRVGSEEMATRLDSLGVQVRLHDEA